MPRLRIDQGAGRPLLKQTSDSPARASGAGAPGTGGDPAHGPDRAPHTRGEGGGTHEGRRGSKSGRTAPELPEPRRGHRD